MLLVVFLFRGLVRRRGEGRAEKMRKRMVGVVGMLVVVAACLSILAMG